MAAKGRFIVVTGATRGLGRSLVARFIEGGHTIAACGRSTNGVDALFKEFGAPHQFTAIDVSDDAHVAGWARDVLQKFGPPDIVVNNAALINHNAPLWKVPADEFASVMDVNVDGTANVIRHFVPAMIERNTGVIVNLSSGWGRTTSAEVAPYCASKWAVEGLTQALAQELPAGMAAVALNPGIINTDMLQSCFGENADSYPDADRWSRIAAPYILSFNSSHNGEPLTVPM